MGSSQVIEEKYIFKALYYCEKVLREKLSIYRVRLSSNDLYYLMLMF